MKRTISKMLGIAALAIAGIAGSLIAATPAQANVACVLWPLPTNPNANYALNGHIYDCMPAPRNINESTFQTDVRNRVNSAIADMTQDEKNKLNGKLVDIVIAYDRTTAESKAGLPVTPSTTAPTETGRTYVFQNAAPNIQHPTTLLWVFAPSQWNPNVIPSNLTSAQGNQITGTVHHEYGHHMDRVWAQTPNGFSPSTARMTANTTNSNYQKALDWDVANMNQTDRNTMISNPSLSPYVKSTSPFAIKENEMYAEQFAITVGGNIPTLDNWILTHFTCSRQFVITQAGAVNNGLPPAKPTASKCYGHTTW